MNSTGGGSTVPRRQLGRKLRELRETRQLTVREVVGALEWSKPRVWRYETGQAPMQPTDVEAMCRLYGADTALTEALKALARQTKSKGWWHSYGVDLPEWFELYMGLEAAASHLRHFESEVIPGLLQTQQYMRAAMGLSLHKEIPPDEAEQRTSIRVERQRILTRREPTAPQVDVILSEAALLRAFNGSIMVDQLTHLAAMADRPNLSIRVLTLGAGPHRGFHGPFVILDFPRETQARDPEPTTVYQEGPTGALYLDRQSEVNVYEGIWSSMASMALDKAESKRLILAITERWAQ